MSDISQLTFFFIMFAKCDCNIQSGLERMCQKYMETADSRYSTINTSITEHNTAQEMKARSKQNIYS